MWITKPVLLAQALCVMNAKKDTLMPRDVRIVVFVYLVPTVTSITTVKYVRQVKVRIMTNRNVPNAHCYENCLLSFVKRLGSRALAPRHRHKIVLRSDTGYGHSEFRKSNVYSH